MMEINRDCPQYPSPISLCPQYPFPNKYYEQRGGVVTKHLYRPDGTLIATVTGTGTNATLRYLHTGNRDN